MEDVSKLLDACIYKVGLMKKYLQRDLVRINYLSSDLELIKKHTLDSEEKGELKNGKEKN